jgi:hypothetical protein
MFKQFKIKSISKEKFIAIRLPSGSLYFGEMVELSSDGTMMELRPETENLAAVLKDSSIKKLRNGYGIQIDYDNSVEGKQTVSFRYEGQFVEDHMIGICKITYQTGEVYNGYVRDGLRDGFGKLTWSDGRTYQGFWRGDRMEGPGVFTGLKEQYEGIFANNLFMTKEGYLISPLLEPSKNEDFGKWDRKGKSTRDKNLHRKYFKIQSVAECEDIKKMAIESFLKDRFVFLVSRLNSGWTYNKLMQTLKGENILVLDCLKASFLYENNKAIFQMFMLDFSKKLGSLLKSGGLLLLNFNETEEKSVASDFDPDMYFILNFTKELGKLLVPKEFKLPANTEAFCNTDKIHESFGILFYADFRLEKGLNEEFARQKVASRFQFFCNPKLADIAVLESPS